MDQNYSGVASNTENGFKHDLFVFLPWDVLACVHREVVLCCVVWRFQIMLARQMSLEASLGH